MMWGGGNRRRANQKHTYDTVPLNIYPHCDVHHDTPVPRVRLKYESCQHQTKRHRNLPDSKQGEIIDAPGTALPTKLSKSTSTNPVHPDHNNINLLNKKQQYLLIERGNES